MKVVFGMIAALQFCSTAVANPADVFAQLWPNQVYVEGTTAMLLISEGGPTPDVWTVQLVDTQDINNPIVLDEATLTVDTRLTFLNADPSSTELEQAGITEMRTETIAAFFNSPAVGQLVLYGTTKYIEVPPFVEGNPPVVFDGFGAMGITADLATAIEEATDLSTAILPSNTHSYPKSIKFRGQESIIIKAVLTDTGEVISAQATSSNQPVFAGDLDCVKQLKNCEDAADARQSAEILSCTGIGILGVTACALPSAECFVGAGACYLVCVGGAYGYEVFCLTSAGYKHDADIIDCGSDYNVCCSENPCPPAE